jgi:hypothetical protein
VECDELVTENDRRALGCMLEQEAITMVTDQESSALIQTRAGLAISPLGINGCQARQITNQVRSS